MSEHLWNSEIFFLLCQVVTYKGTIREKPGDLKEALADLKGLSVDGQRG